MDDVHPTLDTFDDESPTTVAPSPGPANDLSFILDPNQSRSPHEDHNRSVLEVHQTWQGTVLDTVHARSGTVTAGHHTGFRWQLLGKDIAWVPRPLAQVLPFAPPMISEVDTRAKADLLISHEALGERAETPIFVERSGTWSARILAGWAVCLQDDDGAYDLEGLITAGRAKVDGLAHWVEIRNGDRVSIQIGEVDLHARVVPGAKKVAGHWAAEIDVFFLGLVALAGMIAACFAIIVAALPGTSESSATDLEDRLAAIARPIEVEEEPDPVPAADGSLASEAPAKAPEGAPPETRNNEGPTRVVTAQQQLDRDIAMNSGALGALGEAGFVEGMGGPIEASLLDGLQVFTGKGVAGGRGLGQRFSGLGGGSQTDGIGGIGPGCVPGQPCTRGGLPGGTGIGHRALSRKPIGVIDTSAQNSILIGAVDRADIERVIKRNVAKFKYCYQRQLTRDPSLSGKLVTRFVIANDGTVSKSDIKSSSLSPAVDQCVTKTMSRLNFTPPKGGGIAIVSYPFMFSSQ